MSAPAGFYTSEGSLYREGNYSSPFRANYDRHFRTICTVSELKSTIRAGKYSFPGGYAVYFVTSDGSTLSHDTVRKEFRRVADSIRSKANDGWRVVGIGCTCDDDETPICEHSGSPVDE
jgi:hypothetical protein